MALQTQQLTNSMLKCCCYISRSSQSPTRLYAYPTLNSKLLHVHRYVEKDVLELCPRYSKKKSLPCISWRA